MNNFLLQPGAVAPLTALGGGGGKGGGGGSAASSLSSGGSTTTFTFKIDFTVVEGLGGGPSWTLLRAKFPAGGGGGGGGGSSGGSSGGGQLVNLSRTATDTLTMTFAPSCQTPVALDDTVAKPGGSTGIIVLRGELTMYTGINPPTPIPAPLAGILGASNVSNGGFISDSDGRILATIVWSGYGDGKDYVFNGVVTNASTQRPIGRIEIRADGQYKTTSVTATNGMLAKLQIKNPKLDFWDTIPPCDTLSGPAIQSIWNNALSQAQANSLFR